MIRVETTGCLTDAVHKSSNVAAFLISVSLRPIALQDYRLWVDEKVVPTAAIPAFRTNVLDLAATPAMWADRGIHFLHVHLRRSVIDAVAVDLGHDHLGEVRTAVAAEDAVLAQIAKSVAPHIAGQSGASPLALDQLELVLAAHMLQRYGGARRKTIHPAGGLAAWQRRRAAEFLRENLDGKVRLADVAQACDLSVSHFARSFKVTFGVTCHRWLVERRIDRARQLLMITEVPLAEVAQLSGFRDQASFTRIFHQFEGVAPGRWRREHGGGPGRGSAS